MVRQRNLISIAALGLATIPAIAIAMERPSYYRPKRTLLGCWTLKKPPQRGLPRGGETTRCFQRGRAVWGVSIAYFGEGGDFCDRWTVRGQRLWLDDRYGNVEQCLFASDEAADALVVRDCDSAGSWKRSSLKLQGNICRRDENESIGAD